jgi:hypothetical protein
MKRRLSLAEYNQLVWYLEYMVEEGTYYGNRESFDKRERSIRNFVYGLKPLTLEKGVPLDIKL